jgi:glutamate synthase (ferredoxin)
LVLRSLNQEGSYLVSADEDLLGYVSSTCLQVELSSPVLSEGELDALKAEESLNSATLPIFFDISDVIEGALERGLRTLCEAAAAAVQAGSQLLILSDRTNDLEPTKPAIPVLLAVGAVHHHLILNGLRMSASIVADTAQCFSTHQFACLIGYGARYLHYLVFHLISWPFALFLLALYPHNILVLVQQDIE